jgi:large subunit ribosomal protein L18
MESRTDRTAKRRKRRLRYRERLAGTAERPRLTVFRSLKHIYAQAVDDAAGRTLVSASTLDPEVRKRIAHGGNLAAAQIVGEVVAERLKGKGVEAVRFDRAGYLYHGRVKAIADAARKSGLEF